MTLFVLVLLLLMAATIWFAICNNRTFDQRKEILDSWTVYNYLTLGERFSKVSYNTHLWRLFFLKGRNGTWREWYQ